MHGTDFLGPPGAQPLWFKCHTTLPYQDLFQDPLALRLWLLLVTWAKTRGKGVHTACFCYSTVANHLRHRVGRSTVTPTRKQVRRALLFAAEVGAVAVPPPNVRRAEGRAKGYFTVEVHFLDRADGAKSDTGQGSGQDVGRVRAECGPTRGTPSSEKRSETESLSKPRESITSEDQLVQHLLAKSDWRGGPETMGAAVEQLRARGLSDDEIRRRFDGMGDEVIGERPFDIKNRVLAVERKATSGSSLPPAPEYESATDWQRRQAKADGMTVEERRALLQEDYRRNGGTA